MSTRRINDTVQDDAPISRGELAKFADDLVKRPNAAFRHASRRLGDIEQRLGKLGGNADAMRSNIHDIRGNVRHVKNDAEMIRPTFELIRSGGAGIGEPGVRAENLERRSQTAGPSIPFSLFCVWPHVWKSPTPRRFAADGPTIGDGNVGPQGPQKAGPFPERSGPTSQGNQWPERLVSTHVAPKPPRVVRPVRWTGSVRTSPGASEFGGVRAARAPTAPSVQGMRTTSLAAHRRARPRRMQADRSKPERGRIRSPANGQNCNR